MLRTVVIEDEIDSQKLLTKIINEYCIDLEIVGLAENILDGKVIIESQFPDLVFLDIELKDGNSFQLLESLEKRQFKIIFTTAYQEYALKAFKYEAVDYILKPYSPKQVIAAVERVKKRQYDETIYNRLDYLVKQSTKNKHERISIPTLEGVSLFNINDILRLEADRTYCYIYLSDGTKVMVSKPLKEISNMLPETMFFRSHSGHLLNVNYVGKYLNEDGGYALMSDGAQVPVSRRRKKEFLAFLG